MSDNCDINFEQLIDFAVGELEEEESGWLQAHLQSGCSRCQKGLEWLRKVVTVMQRDDSAKPPSWIVRHAAKLFSEPRPASAPSLPLLSRILLARTAARLVYDSHLAMPVAGVRGVNSQSRQLLYKADDLDVDLQIHAGDAQGKSTLVGQILPADGALASVSEAEVQLVDSRMRVLKGTADSFGQFTFEPLSAGSYDLRIRVRDREVEVTGISL